MSFSNQVKNEIYSYIKNNSNDYEKRYACLYGILLYSKCYTKEKIIIQSENKMISELIPELFETMFNDSINLKIEKNKNGKSSIYSFVVDDKTQIALIYEKFSNIENIKKTFEGAFLAGAFMICGSVNDPSKEYHLEFKTANEKLALILKRFLANIEHNAKIVQRKNVYVVYFKDSEAIEDVLTFMGAQDCTLEIMDIKIYKDIRNKANRIANCDSANIDKTIEAAIRQIQNIKLIEDTIGLENISDELKEIAVLRLNNVDMSLKEIGETLSSPISRSGVNHRFKKIEKIADNIRGNMNNGE